MRECSEAERGNINTKRLQTRITADMSRYTENFFLGMSVRQTILSLAGVAVTAAVYIFTEIPGIIAAGAGLPFFILAFFQPDGIRAEKYLAHFLFARSRPQVRSYEGGCDLYEFLWKGILHGRRRLGKKELTLLRRQKGKERRCPTEEKGRCKAAPKRADRAAKHSG